jgi:hypothetical protein
MKRASHIFGYQGLTLCFSASLAVMLPACVSMDEDSSSGTSEQEVTSPIVFFAETFTADGDPGQCGGTGTQIIPMEQWTGNIVIDTDNRAGGCQQQFAVFDPTNVVSGLSLNVNFFGDGDASQCGSPGNHPFSAAPTLSFSTPYRIDTDNRSGGCQQVFELFGRSDVALDVDFEPTGDAGQCGNFGLRTVTLNNPVTFRLDTDGRSGGCTQRFRLRGI